MGRGGGVSAQEARWLALAAQGLAGARPEPTTRLDLLGAIRSVGVVQLDAVNVLQRTQFLVPFSRVGAYEIEALHAMAAPGGELFEYWGHAASLLLVEHEPLLRWRKAGYAAYGETPTQVQRWRAFHEANASYIDAVLHEIRERGPLAASELADPRRRAGEWWDRRSLGRRALEFLFARGELAAWRRPSFERVYDVPERVLPTSILERPALAVDDAHRALLVVAARALGVATAADLAGYYMLRTASTRARLAELVEDGTLVALEVEGWPEPGYAVPDAQPAAPAREHATLLSPFDSLVWDRARTRRLFGFDYRIEIYVPEPKRVHGYYVLPLLLEDRLVARLDLKADRRAGRLVVVAAWSEARERAATVAHHAAAELDVLRTWLGLSCIAVERKGDLATAIERALRARRRAEPSDRPGGERG